MARATVVGGGGELPEGVPAVRREEERPVESPPVRRAHPNGGVGGGLRRRGQAFA